MTETQFDITVAALALVALVMTWVLLPSVGLVWLVKGLVSVSLLWIIFDSLRDVQARKKRT